MDRLAAKTGAASIVERFHNNVAFDRRCIRPGASAISVRFRNSIWSRYYGIALLLALTVLFGAPASGQTPAGAEGKGKKFESAGKDRKPETAERRRNPLQLEAVDITGSPEHPAILFFLPRAKFRLLPFRPDKNWKERVLAETKEMGDAPR